tara:strand:- start:430 stop:1269 length:840 start_codon:yes stop_codon:yes gene_type:complete
MDNRFDRNERFFGKVGQERLRCARLLFLGAGGLGSIAIAQSALLGVGNMAMVDREEISNSNRNRYVGVWHDDPVPGSAKVDIARRHVQLIDPDITVQAINADILSREAVEAVKAADYVVSSVDNDGVRFFINEACLAYEKPLIDLASDVPEVGVFGGRVAVVAGGHGCLHCMDILDPDDVRRFFSSRDQLENEAAVYGIEASALDEAGPSVVSLNGVVVSLGVTALMALITEMPMPYTLQTYRGDKGTVTRQTTKQVEGCYYCSAVKGLGDAAELGRYF